MTELAPDFDEFFGSLIASGVEFLVVGAYALAFHGAPRFTGDIDVFVRPTLENAAAPAGRARRRSDSLRRSCGPSGPRRSATVSCRWASSPSRST